MAKDKEVAPKEYLVPLKRVARCFLVMFLLLAMAIRVECKYHHPPSMDWDFIFGPIAFIVLGTFITLLPTKEIDSE